MRVEETALATARERKAGKPAHSLSFRYPEAGAGIVGDYDAPEMPPGDALPAAAASRAP